MALRERLANHRFVLSKVRVRLAVLSRYAPSSTQLVLIYILIKSVSSIIYLHNRLHELVTFSPNELVYNLI